MFLKTLKPTQIPGKNLKQLRKQLICELNLGPRFNSVHSLWEEITDFHFFKAPLVKKYCKYCGITAVILQ